MSIFSKHQRPFSVPLLAFERFTELRQQITDDDRILESVVIPVLVECCGVSAPTEKDVKYFLERLEQVGRNVPESPEAAKPPTKTLGSAYAEALRNLDVAQLILYMCAFDFHKANYVYTELDRDVAVEMLDTFISMKLQENNLLFESCLYGFGGKYESDKGPVETVDVDLNNPNDLAQLSQFFSQPSIN